MAETEDLGQLFADSDDDVVPSPPASSSAAAAAHSQSASVEGSVRHEPAAESAMTNEALFDESGDEDVMTAPKRVQWKSEVLKRRAFRAAEEDGAADDDAGAFGREAVTARGDPVAADVPAFVRNGPAAVASFLRFPVAAIEPVEFDPATFTEAASTFSAKRQELTHHSGSVIRWRKAKADASSASSFSVAGAATAGTGAAAGGSVDAGGKVESNARLIRWPDGLVQVQIGAEVFNVTQKKIDAGSYELLFVDGAEGVDPCVTAVTHRSRLVPVDIHNSVTHRSLAKVVSKTAAARKAGATQTKRLIDYDREQADLARAHEERVQRAAKAAKASRRRDRLAEFGAEPDYSGYVDSSEGSDVDGGLSRAGLRFSSGPAAGGAAGGGKSGGGGALTDSEDDLSGAGSRLERAKQGGVLGARRVGGAAASASTAAAKNRRRRREEEEEEEEEEEDDGESVGSFLASDEDEELVDGSDDAEESDAGSDDDSEGGSSEGDDSDEGGKRSSKKKSGTGKAGKKDKKDKKGKSKSGSGKKHKSKKRRED